MGKPWHQRWQMPAAENDEIGRVGDGSTNEAALAMKAQIKRYGNGSRTRAALQAA